MKKHLVLILLLANTVIVNAQKDKQVKSYQIQPDTAKVAEEDLVYDIVEVMPEFPGGNDSLFAFIARNIQYPLKCKNESHQGKVYVQFIIERDGSVSGAKILRGVDPDIDAEALRVVRLMPKWKPATQSGKLVRVRYNLPIAFKIDK